MSPTVSIWILVIAVFVTYFLVSYVYKRLGIGNLHQALLVRNGLYLLNLRHALGIVLFGVIFYVVVPDLRYFVYTVPILKLPILLVFLTLTFLSAFLSHVSVKNQTFESVGIDNPKASEAFMYFIIRIVFLFCYEFFFRGILLFMFLKSNNIFTAITFSTILYVFIHVFDSKKEFLGAIPFGVTLSIFAYISGSIWYVFIMHLALSAVYEISVFYHQTIKTE